MNLKHGLFNRFLKWVGSNALPTPEVTKTKPFSQQWQDHMTNTLTNMKRK